MQFHFVSFALCHVDGVSLTFLGLLALTHADSHPHSRTRHRKQNAHVVLLMRTTFEVKAEYQQLNHSNQADQFSCKLQATSFQSHISTTFLILSIVGGFFSVSLFFP